MEQKKRLLFTVLPLFITLFIDTLGATLIIPLLYPIFLQEKISLLTNHSTPLDRQFFYGLTLGIYSICMFFGAPILGALSDRVGRKKILLVCLLGTSLSYFLSVIAIQFSRIDVLLFSRMVGGFTAGSLSTAQAAIIDVSSAETKARNISLLLLIVSLGYIFGPLLGSTLSDTAWFHSFSVTTPMSFIALLSLLNAVFLGFFFKETYRYTDTSPLIWLAGIKSLVSAFRYPKMHCLSFSFLLMQLGWATYFQFIALFLVRRYGFVTNEIGGFMALVGVGFSIACGFLVPALAKRFSLHKITLWAIAISGFIVSLILITTHSFYAWFLAVPIAVSIATAYSTFIGLFSDQVNAHQQGWMLGVVAAINAFSFGVSGLLSGILSSVSVDTPLCIALFAFLFSTIYLSTFKPSEYKLAI